MAFNPMWIMAIMAALQGAQGLFGGGGRQQTQETVTEEDYPHVQDPLYWLTSPYVASNVMQNWDRLQGAGFPAGSQRLGGINPDMLQQILDAISKSWPGILRGFGGATGQPTGIGGQGLRGQPRLPERARRPFMGR